MRPLNLKKQAVAGVKWTGFSTAVITVLYLIRLSILGRLLDPTDFGLVGMVTVITGFAAAFYDMGVSNAVIYKQDITTEQLSSLYWLNIMAGIGVFGMLWAATPLVVAFYREPRLTQLMFWVALVFPIASCGQQFQVLLQKNLQFNVLSKVDISSAAASLLVATTAALIGQGALSLVWAQLANAGTKTVTLYIIGGRIWRPSFHFRRKDLSGYISFGLYQMGERAINYFNSNLDYIMIGTFMGAKALGYYTFAYNLVTMPSSKINPVVTKVAFPVFSKVQENAEQLKRGYFKVLKVLSIINFPVLLGLAAVAPYAVPVVFGKQWLPSVLLIQILAGVGLLRSIGNPLGALIMSKGRADLGFKWNAMIVFTQIPGIYIGIRYGGAVGVALAYLGLQIIYFIAGYYALIRPLLGKCLGEYVGSIWPALWVSSLMSIVVWAGGRALAAVQPAVVFAAGVTTGILLYTGLLLRFDKLTVSELKEMILPRLSKGE